MRWILLAAIALAVSCSSPNTRDSQTGRPPVVATTSMVGDAARVIGGDHIQVQTLMGPGIDPHQYKATAGDLRKLQAARLILYNGLHLEGKMGDIFESLAKRKVAAVAVTQSLDPNSELRAVEPETAKLHDPHVWFDASLWKKCVEVIRDSLCELDPSHSAEFRANATKYISELDELHAEAKAKFATIPADRRLLITAHDAFHYMGRVYGFEVRGLQGISTASEPSTRDVQDLAKLIGERRIPAIFGETSVPDRNIQAVRDAVKRDYKFDVRFVGDRLYSDALGDPNTPAGTYLGMFRHNVNTIVEALK